MKADAPRTIHLADYTPPAYLVEEVHLTFRLAPEATRVISRIAFRPNPEATSRDFALDGEDMTLISARIDGEAITPRIEDGKLTADWPDAPFTFEAEVEIAPAKNTALEGLYMSNGMYCTQCEAEGFRKITFYPDRPDVMAPFTVRIESDLPVLLSNGNPVTSGDGWAEWHDPWPKPAYLFALVAGDLAALEDRFTTRSGREVALNIWTAAADQPKAGFAMEALKRSMVWDEEVYGREYDLDVFNIVAVHDFNSGAMENKGLNIFNAALVLASPETSTDTNFEFIEAVIAHEYFHNWTGNRITCRDWFQLCLKEGLTVFRDQQFTGDMHGHAVKRIKDAQFLRSAQFKEDAGPLAHPVRPESFVEINNFYTVTVYEKGAELIGMLKRLVGDAGYAKALDLYFERHDGEAATIEDWLKVFEDATGRDLAQFKRWYSQAGTPRIGVEEVWEDGTYTLTLTQTTAPTPGQAEKAPLHIPVAVGLLGQDGSEVRATEVLELTDARQSFTFEGLSERPVPSILRGFSAPVNVEQHRSRAQLAFQLAHDTDPYTRWDAGRSLAQGVLLDMIREDAAPDGALTEALEAVLRDQQIDPAFRAMLLALPGEEDSARRIAETGGTPEPLAIHRAHETLREHLAETLQDPFTRLYAASQISEAYTFDARQAGLRAQGNAALAYLSRIDGGRTAARQFAEADNMTQSLAALSALAIIGKGEQELAAFEARWNEDPLVMDKWFGLQVSCAAPERAAATAAQLAEHPAFSMKNPNRFRAVFGALGQHPAGFHAADGAAYELLADWIIRLDPLNPQTAARMVGAFSTWQRYDADRQARMRAAMERIRDTGGLSPDTGEMIGRLLGD